jgi:hypothetical protein
MHPKGFSRLHEGCGAKFNALILRSATYEEKLSALAKLVKERED